MASAGVNVLRWSALGAGVAYGLFHQSQITATSKMAAEHRQYAHKQTLIQQAKAEYAKKTLPPSKKTGAGEIIRDPMDPKFDLEAYLNVAAAESK